MTQEQIDIDIRELKEAYLQGNLTMDEYRKPGHFALMCAKTFFESAGLKYPYSFAKFKNYDVVITDFDSLKLMMVDPVKEQFLWINHLEEEPIHPDVASAIILQRQFGFNDVNISMDDDTGESIITLGCNGKTIKITDDRKKDIRQRTMKIYVDGVHVDIGDNHLS